MKAVTIFAVATILGAGFSFAAQTNTKQLGKTVQAQSAKLKSDEKALLDYLSKQASANPEAANTILKNALLGTKADNALSLKIIQTIDKAAPGQWPLLRETALALRPTLAPQLASYSPAKPNVASIGSPNPLNFPTGGSASNPVGPLPGSTIGGSPTSLNPAYNSSLSYNFTPPALPPQISRP